MPSPAMSKALAIAPKFTAFLSIIGSLGIVVQVLCNRKHRTKTMHRIVMGMSMCDILTSVWYFAGTWAIPSGTSSSFGGNETETIFWAAGDSNGVSCSFAGFFNQFAVATPLYNATLSVYFLLVVNYGWKDNRIAKIEWLFHALPVGYAFATSILAVAFNLYGPVEWTCWIKPDDTIQDKYVRIIQWVFLFGIVWMCIVVVTIIFVVLYRKMKKLERKMCQYAYSSTNTNAYEPSGNGSSSRFFTNSSNGTQRSMLTWRKLGGNGFFRGRKETQSLESSSLKCDRDRSDLESNLKEKHDSESIAEDADRKIDRNDDDNEKNTSNANCVEEAKSINSNCGSVVDKSNEPHITPISQTKKKVIIDDSVRSSVGFWIKASQANDDTERPMIRSAEDADGKIDQNDDKNGKIISNIDCIEGGNSQNLNCSSVIDEAIEPKKFPLVQAKKRVTIDDTGRRSVSWERTPQANENTNRPIERSASFIGKDSRNGGRSEQCGRSSEQYTTTHRTINQDAKSKRIATQGLLYVGAFYVVWIFATVSRITDFTPKQYFTIQFLDSFFVPLQGFLNFLIYIRPRYLNYRSRHQESGFWKSVRVVVIESTEF